VRLLTGHKKDVRAVAYAPDGRLVSGGGDRTVRVWDPVTGACLTTIKAVGPVYAVAAAPDGGTFAYAGRPPARVEFNTVTVCDFAGQVAARYEVRTEEQFLEQPPGRRQFITVVRSVGRSVWSLAFSADGRYLAAACRKLGGGNRLDGAERWVFDRQDSRTLFVTHGATAYALAFAPAGGRLGVTERNQVAFLTSPGAKAGVQYPLPGEWAAAVAFVPGADLAVVGSNSFLFFVNPVRQEKPQKVKTGVRIVSALAVSPGGGTLLAGGRPGAVEVYDVASRTRVRVYDFPIGGVHAVAFAPDGQTFAVAGDDGLVVADVEG
jgi:WD40 repeat protein